MALRPDFTSAHFNRGMTLVQLGDKAKAIDAFKAAMATKKDFADAYYMIGYLLRDKGDTAGALDSFKLAVSTRPTTPATRASWHRPTWPAGISPTRRPRSPKALAQDPENAVANYNMASVKIKLGKPREALPFAQKAVREGPAVGLQQLHPGACEREAGQHG